jgi:hypothetical protein
MSQTRSVEWLLACMMVAWGIGLLLPGDTMSLPQFRMLGVIAPEPVWAVWSISMGAVRVAALYINGSWRRTPLLRVLGASFGLIWWLVLGFLFKTSADGGPVPAGLLWFPVFIAFEGYSIVRGARDSYHTGALQRWQPNKP